MITLRTPQLKKKNHYNLRCEVALPNSELKKLVKNKFEGKELFR